MPKSQRAVNSTIILSEGGAAVGRKGNAKRSSFAAIGGNSTGKGSPKKSENAFVSKRPGAVLLRFLVRFGAVATVCALLGIVGYILIKGIPCLSPELFSIEYNSDNVSLLPSLFNTLFVMLIALALGSVFGIASAIYLVEYTGRGNKFVKLVGLTVETLAGIPSIVYGLFGMLFFVIYLGWGMSLLAGAFTLAIITLPIIMRTTQEALKAVPDTFREGSFGLGAGRVRTVFRVVLPSAVPGILAGIILSIGRIVGESAALIYTAGTIATLPDSVFDSTRTLAVHMYVLASEGLHIDQTYATAVVLLVVVFIINTASSAAAKRIGKRKS